MTLNNKNQGKITKNTCISFKPIGYIRSPFKSVKGMPIQPAGGKDKEGKVVLYPEFQDGLKNLDGFSHVFLLYFFHQVNMKFTRFVSLKQQELPCQEIISTSISKNELIATPYMDSESKGIFAIRAPRRPNPIGLSVVAINKIEKNVIFVKNIDVLDGTPLLDIKPFVPNFDIPHDIKSLDDVKVGWLKYRSQNVKHARSDERFKKN
ncbi:MAG: SAM-dependent methyltransferase [Promethearchaeota archaeon]